MLNRQSFFKIVSTLLTLGAIYFGFVYLNDIYSEIKSQYIEVNYFFILLSIVSFILFYLILSVHWNRVCELFDSSKHKQYLTFFASQPYKYLPTSLFTFSFRAKYSKDLGMSIKKSSVAQLLENINMLSTGVGVGAILYLIHVGLYYLLFPIFLAALIVYYFLPQVIKLRIKSKTLIINKKEELLNLGLTSVAWLVSGISFYLLSKGLGVNTCIVESLSANALAYTLGIVAFFAPGGIGIREWVFSLYSISNVVVLGWRILTFFADLILGFAGIMLVSKQSRKLLS